MDHLVSRESELEVDLESGETASEDEITNDLIPAGSQSRKILNRALGGHMNVDGFGKRDSSISYCSNASKLSGVEHENLELLIEKNSEGEDSCQHVVLLGKKTAEGRNKKNRKPPRPPRPPKGPTLSAADQKLVREIAELAMRKQARIERIKALKKMKTAKSSSSSSTISAMVVTVLFCLIILFQGMLSRSSASAVLAGSPAPAVASGEGLISVKLYKSFSPTERDQSGLRPLSFADKQIPGSDSNEDASKVAR